MQSHNSHQSVVNRLHSLLDDHLFSICSLLSNESSARRKFTEFPRFINYNRLTSFDFIEEPFFRQVLLADAKASIQKLRKKTSIDIPPHLARFAFGVIDVTGQLNYGQVFFQYTSNHEERRHNSKARSVIHKGPLMVHIFNL